MSVAKKARVRRRKGAVAAIGGEKVGVHGGLPMVYRQIRTEDDARSLANAMADTGNYPHGMSPCETAGINGDQPLEDHCIFDDQDFCRCAELLGFKPREECTDHTDAEHYPAELAEARR
jgi:hypothetical protein